MVEEHLAVHGRLEELDRALVGLVADPDTGVAGVRTALAQLDATLLEHLAYEEEQLVEPLNRLGFGV